MKKVLVIGVLCLILVSCVYGYICINNEKYDEEINKERTDYNTLLRKHILENPYKLGDDLIPIKPMKR